MFTFAQTAVCDGVRAYWVEYNLPGFRTRGEVDMLIADMVNTNINTIMVHVRDNDIHYYRSNIVPRTSLVTDTFDPLGYIIEKAHAASKPIKVYAWLSLYTVWDAKDKLPDIAGHVMNAHPEWLDVDRDGNTWDGVRSYWLSPGVPQASEHLRDMIMEIVTNYDVDGIQLDYVRMADYAFGYNPTMIARYNAINGLWGIPAASSDKWSEFRRNQISDFVRRIYAEINLVKPSCLLSAAVTTGLTPPISYDERLSAPPCRYYYSDWHSWINEGIIDLTVPMTYFDDATSSDKYDAWIDFCANYTTKRTMIMAMCGYKNSAQEAYNQLLRAKNNDGCDGQIILTYDNPFKRGMHKNFVNYLKVLYPQWLEHPTFEWKSNPEFGHIFGRVTDFGKGCDTYDVVCAGRRIKTDSNGYYAFIDLPSGEYTVKSRGKEAKATVARGTVSVCDISLSDGKKESAPTIFNIGIKITSDGFVVSWETDMPSTSVLSYGDTTISDENHVTRHNVLLPILPGSFTVSSTSRCNMTTSVEHPKTKPVMLTEALSKPDGTEIMLREKITVTAVFGDCIYGQTSGFKGVKIVGMTAEVGDEIVLRGVVRHGIESVVDASGFVQ